MWERGRIVHILPLDFKKWKGLSVYICWGGRANNEGEDEDNRRMEDDPLARPQSR
jgi:hypothetical protein